MIDRFLVKVTKIGHIGRATSVFLREDFCVEVFRALAKDDLYRALEVAKSFKNEAPRGT